MCETSSITTIIFPLEVSYTLSTLFFDYFFKYDFFTFIDILRSIFFVVFSNDIAAFLFCAYHSAVCRHLWDGVRFFFLHLYFFVYINISLCLCGRIGWFKRRRKKLSCDFSVTRAHIICIKKEKKNIDNIIYIGSSLLCFSVLHMYYLANPLL